MKKQISLALLLFTSSLAIANLPQNSVDGDKSNPTVSTVQQALKAKDNTPVQLTGYIIESVANEDDEFIFQDNTGKIQIEVDDKDQNGIKASSTEKVTIYGEVDTESKGQNKIDVDRIQKN